MNDKQIEAWKKVREKGKARYIALIGGSYGVAMFFFMTFFQFRNWLNPRFIAISALLWIVGGALFGLTMWVVGERRFQKATARGAHS